ncbi:hypothetical protein A2U01_0062920, partial [Trifolium medium]|nr:hypothetical protein [Trifolium medium]
MEDESDDAVVGISSYVKPAPAKVMYYGRMRRCCAIRRSRKMLNTGPNKEIDKCDDVPSRGSVSVEVTDAKKWGRKRKIIVSSSEEDDEVDKRE